MDDYFLDGHESNGEIQVLELIVIVRRSFGVVAVLVGEEWGLVLETDDLAPFLLGFSIRRRRRRGLGFLSELLDLLFGDLDYRAFSLLSQDLLHFIPPCLHMHVCNNTIIFSLIQFYIYMNKWSSVYV